MASIRSSGIPLFRYKGIQVLVHWSFFLLVGWVLFSSMREGQDLLEATFQVGLVLMVFACVVLHEFGHALTALHFGVRTRNIMLLPIGGVASLERMPEEPRQELLITLAGPAVNLALVLLLGIPFWLYMGTFGLPELTAGPPTFFTFLAFLIAANGVLFLFNLIPAFPMDGGRILRSLLSMRMDRIKATRIATVVGRVLAVGFVLAAIETGNFMWGLIGVFVYFGATAENRQVVMQQALKGLHVRNVLRTRFWSLPHTATLQQALDDLLTGGDQDLLVLREGRPDRILGRSVLLSSAAEMPVTATLDRIYGVLPPALHPEADVRQAFELLATGQYPLLPVVERGTVIGIVELENVSEYLTLKGLMKQH